MSQGCGQTSVETAVGSAARLATEAVIAFVHAVTAQRGSIAGMTSVATRATDDLWRTISQSAPASQRTPAKVQTTMRIICIAMNAYHVE
jgi:hypothetical protein